MSMGQPRVIFNLFDFFSGDGLGSLQDFNWDCQSRRRVRCPRLLLHGPSITENLTPHQKGFVKMFCQEQLFYLVYNLN